MTVRPTKRRKSLAKSRQETPACICLNKRTAVLPPRAIMESARRAANSSHRSTRTIFVFLDRDGAIIDGCPIWEVEGEVYRALLYRNFIGNASVPLIRRSVLNEIGGYDESMRAAGAQGCEDWDICLRIAERYEFRVVREYLVGYRIAAGSMSSDYTSMARGHALLLRRARERHPEIPRRVFRW